MEMAEGLIGQLQEPLRSGVPEAAVASYARWWQIETYAREVVYTELRAKYGSAWTEHLNPRVPNRAERDRINSYMASADADDMLAYADTSVLFELIEENWELFEKELPPEQRWSGMTDTMLAIRHRIAHCRRPHRDDLARLEQWLRDLEVGARIFYGAYVSTRDDLPKRKDRVVRDWIGKRHEAADRLIEHCERKYGTHFRLSYSVRPWAQRPDARKPISGEPGVLWHADWVLGSRELELARFWKSLPKSTQDLCLHVLVGPFSVTATFAAVEDPVAVSEAMAAVFESTIQNSRQMRNEEGGDDWLVRLEASAEELPAKVSYNSAFSLFDTYDPEAFSIFSA